MTHQKRRDINWELLQWGQTQEVKHPMRSQHQRTGVEAVWGSAATGVTNQHRWNTSGRRQGNQGKTTAGHNRGGDGTSNNNVRQKYLILNSINAHSTDSGSRIRGCDFFLGVCCRLNFLNSIIWITSGVTFVGGKDNFYYLFLSLCLLNRYSNKPEKQNISWIRRRYKSLENRIVSANTEHVATHRKHWRIIYCLRTWALDGWLMYLCSNGLKLKKMKKAFILEELHGC